MEPKGFSSQSNSHKIEREQTKSYQDKIIKAIEAMPDLKRGTFTSFEDSVIKKYYPTKGSKGIATALNKTSRQVSNRARAMGVRFIPLKLNEK